MLICLLLLIAHMLLVLVFLIVEVVLFVHLLLFHLLYFIPDFIILFLVGVGGPNLIVIVTVLLLLRELGVNLIVALALL